MLKGGVAGCTQIFITEEHKTGMLLRYLDDPHHVHTQKTRQQLVPFTELRRRWESKLSNTGIARYVPRKQTSLVHNPSHMLPIGE